MTDLAELRKPFPPEVIGKLPRVTQKDAPKNRCDVCGGFLPPHIHLDYVGHAEVTDRLLSVDPLWDWEPFALDADGLPLIRNGRLWIRLTVLGVTRIGCGSVLENKPDLEKELISDAIRNAAMRFGVALDLWAKADLESQIGEPEPQPAAPTARRERKEQGQKQPSATTAPHPAVGPVAGDTQNGNGVGDAPQGRLVRKEAEQAASPSMALGGDAVRIGVSGVPGTLPGEAPPCTDDADDPALIVKRLRLRVRAMRPAIQQSYDEEAARFQLPKFARPGDWTSEQIGVAIRLIEEFEESEKSRVAVLTP